jgi:hypothetical protein
MAGIIILNIVFAAFVVIGVFSLLSWGVVRNKTMAASLSDRAHVYAHRQRTPRGAPVARGYGRATGHSS